VDAILRDMRNILTNNKTGVGLAAPQAGHCHRIIMVNYADIFLEAFINPVIVDHGETMQIDDESCLSYPGRIMKKVERYNFISIKFNTLDGDVQQREFIGMPSRIIQHEIDHLDGNCIFDRS